MLNPVTIKQQVADLIASNKEADPSQAEDNFAQGLTDIIVDAIKSATVSVDIPVGSVSVGSFPPVVPTPVPIPLTGTLS